MLEVTNEIRIPITEFEFQFSRSSGPGGQNVNKVNSKAQLRWNLASSPSLPEAVKARFKKRFASKLTSDGSVLITSDRTRDRILNQEDCLKKLCDLLREVAYPPKPRKKTKPSRSVQTKRKESRKKHSEKKRARSRKNWQ